LTANNLFAVQSAIKPVVSSQDHTTNTFTIMYLIFKMCAE